MKPAEHPEFFRLPPPEGRSRESGIVLDRQGRFWHHGELVQHPGMARAFASWVAVHPDDGRYILNNQYDWSYITVEDAPFFVLAVRAEESLGGAPVLELSDGTREPLEPRNLESSPDGGLYVQVKSQLRARFTPSAQLELAPWIEQLPDGRVCVRVGESRWSPDDA